MRSFHPAPGWNCCIRCRRTNAGGLTEGPAVAPDGSIYFSDIPSGEEKGQILRFDPTTGKTGVFTADSGKSNGLAFDAHGDLIACEGADHGGRCVSRWNVKTGKRTVLVDRFEGKRFNAPNDVTIDAKGRIYFTDPKYVGSEPRELEHRSVYVIDPDGKTHEVTHDVEKPNGIAISPDQKTLYVADTNNGADGSDPAGTPPRKGAMKVYALSALARGQSRRTAADDRRLRRRRRLRRDDGRRPRQSLSHRAQPQAAGRAGGRPRGQGVGVHRHRGHRSPSDKLADEAVGLPSNCEFGIGAREQDALRDDRQEPVPHRTLGRRLPHSVSAVERVPSLLAAQRVP